MKIIWQSLRMVLWMTLFIGLFYPVFITLISFYLFPDQSSGSLLIIDGKVRGSKLIAQKFTDDRYFWPRPSAVDYHPLPSGASNLGPISAELKKLVEERRKTLVKGGNADPLTVPADLIFASGSGLDPHISPEAAYFQIERIAKARSMPAEKLKEIVAASIEKPTLRVMGQARVNVLMLNHVLDEADEKHE
ncbi:MAG: potassium-transporting ATPase subunit KdpC [Chlamydiales bacterium]